MIYSLCFLFLLKSSYVKVVLSGLSLSSAWQAMLEGKIIPNIKKTPWKKNSRIHFMEQLLDKTASIRSFFILSACMGTSIHAVTLGNTVPFPSPLRKWNSHRPNKGKWLYGSPLHIQPGWQVPAGHFCGLAGEEPCPQLSIHPSSLFPQPRFPLPSWSLPLTQIYAFPPKQRLSWFWQALTGCFASPCPPLALIHFQHECLDQLVLMLACPERQAEQVLSTFPWAFIFLAPPQWPSLSPAATATAPASETVVAATFQRRLHQLGLFLLFLMLFVPVNDWRSGWSSAAAGFFCWGIFSFFFVEADIVSETVSSKNIQDNSQLQNRAVERSPLLNSLYIC